MRTREEYEKFAALIDSRKDLLRQEAAAAIRELCEERDLTKQECAAWKEDARIYALNTEHAQKERDDAREAMVKERERLQMDPIRVRCDLLEAQLDKAERERDEAHLAMQRAVDECNAVRQEALKVNTYFRDVARENSKLADGWHEQLNDARAQLAACEKERNYLKAMMSHNDPVMFEAMQEDNEDLCDARNMLTRINAMLPIKGGAEHGRAIDEAVQESLDLIMQERDNIKRLGDYEHADKIELHRQLSTIKNELAKLREALQEISAKLPCYEPCVRREPGMCPTCKHEIYDNWCSGCVARAVLATCDAKEGK